ncbi:hypothetical protein D3C73_1302040 [compost metagenome]
MPGVSGSAAEEILEVSTKAGTWRVRRTLASSVTLPAAVEISAGPSGESSGRYTVPGVGLRLLSRSTDAASAAESP